MRFHSILFDRPESRLDVDQLEEPSFFVDLNLDQVLESMTIGREEYALKPFFYAPLRDVEDVHYRHEVLHDLEEEATFASVAVFTKGMQAMHAHLARAEKLYVTYQKQRWFLDAVKIYCGSVGLLADELARLDLSSRGFRALRDYLIDYTKSGDFTSLLAETDELQAALAEVKYLVHIKGNRVRVSKYEEGADYSTDIEQTFAKFQQGAVKDYRAKLPDSYDMNHVEARILDLVARLYPNLFRTLEEYCARHRGYLDPAVGAFDREVQFYVAYLEYIERFTSTGLTFCYPKVSQVSKEIYARDAFDLALANKLVPENSQVVCNDVCLQDPERIVVVTGPNQGGKTTFARMFGQLHYLASLGYPVPGREAVLFLPDRLFSQFEREEDLATLRGKLEDELVRTHEMLREATSDSVIVMNESFTSTTVSDALFIGREVMKQIIDLGALCVYVTFVDELASLSESTVSMVSMVDPDNPAVRTFKVMRKPADGLAYAAAIARKYGLSHEALRKRIAR